MHLGFYIVIPKNTISYNQILLDCDNNQNTLSIAQLNDNSVMIKVLHGSTEWLDLQIWKNEVITYFTHDKQKERLDYYYSRQDIDIPINIK